MHVEHNGGMSKRTARRPVPPSAAAACPCGAAAYGDCCGPLHVGAAAPTAERLMRSRYSAFAIGDRAHLLRTWHPRTRPAALDPDPGLEWVRLEVLGTTGGTAFHNEGTVDFRAVYREDGHERGLREHSRFLRHEGAWVYLDASA
jgi:SEC-C motif-containing protein